MYIHDLFSQHHTKHSDALIWLCNITEANLFDETSFPLLLSPFKFSSLDKNLNQAVTF